MENKNYQSICRSFLPKQRRLLVRLFVFLFMALSGTPVFSQYQWNKDFIGRDTSNSTSTVIVEDFSAVSVRQFRDGYSYLVGTIADPNTNTPYASLAKIDQAGTVIWAKNFRENTEFIDIRIVDSTKLLILGMSTDSNGRKATFLLKTDSSGAAIWKYKYTSSDTSTAMAVRVIDSKSADTTEAYTLVTTVENTAKVLFVKVDKNNGNVITQNSFKLIPGERYKVRDMIQTADGNYAICGESSVFPNPAYEAFVAKVSQDIDSVIWSKKVDISDNSTINGLLEVDSAGYKHLYCIGTAYITSPSAFSMFIMKSSKNLDTVKWCRAWGGLEGSRLIYTNYDSVNFIAKWPGNQMGLLGKAKVDGSLLQLKKDYTYNTGGGFYSVQEIIETKDAGFLIAGTNIYPAVLNRYTVSLIKTNYAGESTCSTYVNNPPGSQFFFTTSVIDKTPTSHSYSYQDTITGSFAPFFHVSYRPCSVVCDTTALTHQVIGDTASCEQIILKANSSNKYNYYTWLNYNTGKFVTAYQDTLVVKESGKWTLQAFNSPTCNNLTNSQAKAVVFKEPKPDAGFDTTYTPCLNYMQFNDTSQIDTAKGKIAFRLWNFDYPSTSLDSIGFGKSTYFAYPDTGSYTVRLITFANNGCTDTAFKTIHIDTFGGNPALNISASSAYWHPYNKPLITIDPSSNTYTAYKWYRNGSLLTAPCCPSYKAIQPGDYRVEALGDCGWEISNTLSLRPDCADDKLKQDFVTGGRLGTSTYSNDTGYYVGSGQSLVINSGIVTFSNTTLVMGECSEIRVEKGARLNLTSTKIVGCGQWKGIVVKGDQVFAQSGATHGNLYMTASYLSDAAIGVYAADGGYINLFMDSLENNYVHVGVGPYYNYTNAGVMDSCVFGQLKVYPYKNFDSIPCKPSWWRKPSSFVALSGDTMRIQPAVYLDSVFTFRYLKNNFNYNRFYTPPMDAIGSIENRQASLYIYDSRDLWVQLSKFEGPQQYGMMLKKVKGDSVNYFINNFFKAQPASLFTNSLITGAYVEETGNLYMDGNEFTAFPRGMEYYNFGNSKADTILGGWFLYNSYGLTVSPRKWPYTIDSTNTDTGKIKLIVKCNQFKNNGYGISGSGNIVDQKMGDSATNADIGNVFTTNQNWDLIWQDYDTPYMKYLTASPSNPSAPDTANNSDVVFRPWVILNGVNLNNPYYIQQTTAFGPDIEDNDCRVFFSKMGPNVLSTNSKDIKPDELVKVYPNPFNGQVTVKFDKEIKSGSVELYDVMGRLILRQTVAGDLAIVQSGGLSTGFYILVVKEGPQVIHKEKLLKAQE